MINFTNRKAIDACRAMLLALLLLIHLSGRGQTDQEVYLPGGKMSNMAIRDSIAHQTGLGLDFYKRAYMELHIYMPEGKIPLHRILKYCLRPLNLYYWVEGRTIWTAPRPPGVGLNEATAAAPR